MVVDIVLPAVLGSMEGMSLFHRGRTDWIRTGSDLGIAHRSLDIGRWSMGLKAVDTREFVPNVPRERKGGGS